MVSRVAASIFTYSRSSLIKLVGAAGCVLFAVAVISFLAAPVLAQTQSHPLSQITADTSLNMNAYNVTNANWVIYNTGIMTGGVRGVPSQDIQGGAITSSNLASNSVGYNQLTNPIIGYLNATGYYDRINPSYYLIPSSTSVINGLQAAGSAYLATSSGNVGIGTTSPVKTLDVVGTINATSQICLAGSCQSSWPSGGGGGWTASGSYLYNNTAGVQVGIGTSSPASLLSLYQSGSNTLLNASNGTINAGIYVGTLSGGYAGASIGTNSNHQFRIFTNGTDRLTVDTSGYVGIGTAGPAAKLQIAGLTGVNGGLAVNDGTRTIIVSTDANGGTVGTSTNHPLTLVTNSNGRLVIEAANTETMRLTSAGNVGIGTFSPSARLHINASDNQTAPLRVDMLLTSNTLTFPSFMQQWQYRRNITVNGSTSEQDNYQVNLLINSSNVGGNFNWSTYGNDTRFTWLNTTSNAEQNVSFWIEYWNNATAGNNASIWVKVPNVTASSVANTTLYMYYGNLSATYNNTLGGNNVFLFFDDFNAGAIGSIWTIIAGSVTQANGVLNIGGDGRGMRSTSTFQYPLTMEFMRRDNVYAYYGITGFDDGTIGPSYYATIASTGTTEIWPFYGWTVGGGHFNFGNLGTNYRHYRIDWINSTTIGFSYNGTFLTGTATGPIANKYVQISGSQDASNPNFDVDWIFVRSYASPAPSVLSVGSEQTSSIGVQLSQTVLYIQNGTGYVGIGTASPDAALSVNGSADKSSGGSSWGTFSDARLKTVDGTFDRGLAELMRLQPVKFHYKEGNALGLPTSGENYGFVAQDVRKAIPEAVYNSPSGYLMISADPIFWTMVNSIKEQQKEIETLKSIVCSDHPSIQFCR